MLAWDSATSMLKRYRVDEMTDISASYEPRKGKYAFVLVDMSDAEFLLLRLFFPF